LLALIIVESALLQQAFVDAPAAIIISDLVKTCPAEP